VILLKPVDFVFFPTLSHSSTTVYFYFLIITSTFFITFSSTNNNKTVKTRKVSPSVRRKATTISSRVLKRAKNTTSSASTKLTNASQSLNESSRTVWLNYDKLSTNVTWRWNR